MNASRDENSVPTLIAADSSNGAAIIRVQADSSTHALKVDDNTTGSDFGPQNALRDQNDVPVLLAVSSADGVTPVVVYTDSNGNLLIDSN